MKLDQRRTGGTSTSGRIQGQGRGRSPLPAARIIAFMPVAPQAAAGWPKQLAEHGQFRPARQHRFYISKARHIGEVPGFAVAMADAREDADHLEVALHAHQVAHALELGDSARHRQARLTPAASSAAARPARALRQLRKASLNRLVTS